MATNPGPATVNLRAAPRLEAQNLGILDVGQSAPALGQSADGTWIMIEVPAQAGLHEQAGVTAWVYASLVQVSGPGGLPVITATP